MTYLFIFGTYELKFVKGMDILDRKCYITAEHLFTSL